MARLNFVAGLHVDRGDFAGDIRRHFDGGLVGFEFEDGLIDGQRVADLDQHFEDVALRDAVTKIR